MAVIESDKGLLRRSDSVQPSTRLRVSTMSRSRVCADVTRTLVFLTTVSAVDHHRQFGACDAKDGAQLDGDDKVVDHPRIDPSLM